MMKPFLQIVAEDLMKRTGGDLSHTLVVFPGKRASLFLDDYLLAGDVPIWSPRYATIDELFGMFCNLTLVDPIDAACRIYKLYVQSCQASGQKPDALDHFYGWAERLLSDFDEIDKALVNAENLFVNLGDLREIDARDFLTEKQREALRSFFKDFDPARNSYIRDRFLHLWRAMPQIYQSLWHELSVDGLAYSGMLQRKAVMRLEAGEATIPAGIERIVFVGFNLLSAVERKLFTLLQKETEVLFYWDYDTYLTADKRDDIKANNEVGSYMRQNLTLFPNALPIELFNNLLKPRQIEYISASTDSAQARYVSTWLQSNLTADARRTAVVLCDEQLLQPVLHSLPEEVQTINVTKGYPLVATNTYAEALRLMSDLEKRGVSPSLFIEKVQASIQKTDEAGSKEPTDAVTILEREARFTVYTVLTRLDNLVRQGKLAIQTTLLLKLARQILRTQTIAFHGEPVEGLQIMGVLETRCLDFDNVLLLSADDSHLPRPQSESSFIPYFLRDAYGLPTRRDSSAVYASYFYRLLSRAKHFTAVWCNAGDGAGGGEMSRFLMQLLLEAPSLSIKRVVLQAQSASAPHPTLSIPKPANLVETLSSLSPSALNDYLLCPMKLYFSRVKGVKVYKEPSVGMEQNVFGTIFHLAAQLLYRDLTQDFKRPITALQFRDILSRDTKPLLQKYIVRAFNETVQEETTLEGTIADYPVENEVLLRILKDLLRADSRLGGIRILELEGKHKVSMQVQTPTGPEPISIGGIIDRLDVVSDAAGRETLRILDYKTGNTKKTDVFKDVESLFSEKDDRPKYVFQTFLYAWTMRNETTLPIRPALYYTSQGYKTDYNPYVSLGNEDEDDARPFFPEFEERLKALLEEIFDTKQPFEARPNKTCSYCDFRNLCQN